MERDVLLNFDKITLPAIQSKYREPLEKGVLDNGDLSKLLLYSASDLTYDEFMRRHGGKKLVQGVMEGKLKELLKEKFFQEKIEDVVSQRCLTDSADLGFFEFTLEEIADAIDEKLLDLVTLEEFEKYLGGYCKDVLLVPSVREIVRDRIIEKCVRLMQEDEDYLTGGIEKSLLLKFGISDQVLFEAMVEAIKNSEDFESFLFDLSEENPSDSQKKS